MKQKAIEDQLRLNRAKHVRQDSNMGWLSLASIVGKKIIDLEGHVSHKFGVDTPVFDISAVVFEDGTTMRLQGEHDIAYLPADDEPGVTKRELLLLTDPDDMDEEDEDELVEELDEES